MANTVWKRRAGTLQVGKVNRLDAGHTARDAGGIAPGRPRHGGCGAIDGENAAGGEPFADVRDGRTVAAANLKHAMVRSNVEQVDRPAGPRRDHVAKLPHTIPPGSP